MLSSSGPLQSPHTRPCTATCSATPDSCYMQRTRLPSSSRGQVPPCGTCKCLAEANPCHLEMEILTGLLQHDKHACNCNLDYPILIDNIHRSGLKRGGATLMRTLSRRSDAWLSFAASVDGACRHHQRVLLHSIAATGVKWCVQACTAVGTLQYQHHPSSTVPA